MNNLEPINKPVSEMTTAELEQYLAEKKKAEQAEQRERMEQFKKDKDNFLQKAAEEFVKENEYLKKLKHEVIDRAQEFYSQMYHLQNREPRDVKGFTLKDEDNTVKLEVEAQERMEFTEQAIVHISEIKDIFRRKFAKRNKGLYDLLESLLIKSKEGDYDPKLLAKARKQVRALGDQHLIDEFDALDECQRVSQTSTYCRLYVRKDDGRFKDVSLQFSSL